NITMSLNGRATQLVADASGIWHATADDGSQVLRSSDAGLANGDTDNQYWQVTTPDGTRYVLGRNRLPGWQQNKPTTNSVWTEPVYGNHPGEPCHKDAFADSWCQRAWRWNLDYVVDPHGNSMAYYYGAEGAAYARDLTGSQRTGYVRGGWLDHVDYGMRA